MGPPRAVFVSATAPTVIVFRRRLKRQIHAIFDALAGRGLVAGMDAGSYLAAVTLRGCLFVTMLAVFRRIKRHIKQSPRLWRAFSRARALAGVLNAR